MLSNAERDVTERGAQLVVASRCVRPVVGELEDGGLGLVAVADEGEREGAARIVLAAQQLHAQLVAIEVKGAIEVAHPEHRVEQPHRGGSLTPAEAVLVAK